MPVRGNFCAEQLNGYPDDPTQFLAGQVNPDGSNKWRTPTGIAQSLSASGNKFIESYDASTGLFVARRPTEADLSLSDITTNNVTSSAHGLAPKSPADATQFLNGAATPAYAAVKDSDLSTSDITTNNVSTSKHGFAPKLPNDATKFLDGTGAWSVPSGGGSSPSATTVSTTSLSYTAGERKTFDLTVTGKTLMLLQVTEASGKKFRFQLYATSALRASDASRGYTVPIALGQPTGIGLDLYIPQVSPYSTPFQLTPVTPISNGDTVRATTIYAAVTSLETSTQTIQVTVTYVPMES